MFFVYRVPELGSSDYVVLHAYKTRSVAWKKSRELQAKDSANYYSVKEGNSIEQAFKESRISYMHGKEPKSNPTGDRTTLHGAFKSAAQAQRKKASIRGAFVQVRKIGGQTRYVVVSHDARAVQKARYAGRSAMNPGPKVPLEIIRKSSTGYLKEKIKELRREYLGSAVLTRKEQAYLRNLIVAIQKELDERAKGGTQPNPGNNTVIYSRAVSIIAQKGRNHRCDAACVRARHTYKHDFQPGVRIIGLKNGDVLLSKR